MIRIITDSTSDIGLDYAKELNIEIVPLKVIFNTAEYKDRIDLQPEKFYELLENCDALPTTSQPAPQDFMDFFEDAKQKKDSVILITLSSGLSGTYQNACMAKDLVEYEDIHIIDSLSATQALRLIVEKAVSLRDKGFSAEEIVKEIENYKTRVKIYGIVDTLEFLFKGGRLSRTSATVGSVLKLKPIIGFKEKGKLDVFGKARGTQKATDKLIDLIKQGNEIDLDEPVCIAYTGNNTSIEKFENKLKDELGIKNVKHGVVGPVIGTHAGPGACLITYVTKK
ncbi:DegV family protein [Amedibacterium intestinale]|uniref:DegV family protein n=1 Tax=Amedibacterium intestinale TaxID=2583452 RepID=A0A6N4TKV5_9FIRM|nr:DegV family protein [Amedibacterium intestinale]RHO20084.1 DegV family protein [Eubacterium sp. AM18-26]RHO23730.1 DegV family protein [Eubacterium sp. AM18-10LB-B]RHO27637.1 DegV family protein [Erysipelotrichaceae bacterium AM17-60]BBK23211.1 DegV family protein [Amedibacterium intestinale]BBK62955.1 DegV family protein [Amedibacterium intestinale]